MTYAPKPSYESLEETIDDLKSRRHAATEKSECGHLKMFWLPSTADIDEGIANPGGHCHLCAEVQAAYERGSNWMLDAIRGTLRGYPNHGGDIEVMQEVERIEKAAYERGLRDAGEHSLERYTDYHYRCQCGTLLSSDRVEALIEWRLHILALKDRGAK